MWILLSLASLAAAPELPTERNELFAASGNCSQCHTSLKGADGQDISPDTTWRGAMMANAARDPYWRATVRAEVQALPDLGPTIEAKCALCHTPMASTTDVLARRNPALLDTGHLSAEHELHGLAMDGVSCTVCHQIKDHLLGQPGSFSGHFTVDSQAPADRRPLYGPNPIDFGPREMMRVVSGFDPVQGRHLGRSGMCATCHTLFTPYVDDAGQVAGEFPEQTPYLEWQASAFAGEADCVDCHMPEARFGDRPYLVHHFRGGNAYVARLLAVADPEALELAASPAHFEAAAARSESYLSTESATLALEGSVVADGTLKAEVVVASTTGHKLPSGFPSRRVWLHLVVRDAGGAAVFESGAWAADGTITGNDNDADGSTFEPHYAAITGADQVQIYEPILATTSGAVTTRLLRAAAYAKDNRLLAPGMDKASLSPDIAVYGAAMDDPDFDGGGDRVRLEVPVSGSGPYTVEAELLYQSIGERWAREIEVLGEGPKRKANAEAAVFAELAAKVPNAPITLATASATAE